MEILSYYSRKDVLKEMLKLANDREVQVWFGKMPGHRPDTVAFEGDILDLAKKGMSSFHISVERWKDPLKLKPGMSKRDLDNLRVGWDLLLDIDSKWLEGSYLTAVLLIDALKFHNVKNFGVKFSGNHGFHIIVPFEAFPSEVNGVNIKDYFPDGLRIIANYLKDMIKEYLSENILEKGLDYVASQTGKRKEDFIINGSFDPFTVVDIDSVLISSRHLFRGVYSLNEKSGLISVPLNDIKDFKLETYKEDFKPENVKISVDFLKKDVKVAEASQLLMQAFDWNSKQNRIVIKEEDKKTKNYNETPTVEISKDFFPPCVLSMFNGIKEDGRKRSIFVLINFLRAVGWNWDSIEKTLLEMNKKSYEPLRDGYIIAQVSWSKRQSKSLLPPNCDNKSYYTSMGVCSCKDGICNKIKNPVNYVFWKLKNVKKKVSPLK